MDFTNDSNHIDKHRRRDFEDLQNEVAGRETGRAARFLPTDARAGVGDEKKRSEEAFRSYLALLLDDPIYRVRYEHVSAALSEAEIAADQALQRLGEQIAAAETRLSKLEAGAARLPNGEAAFRDADGVVRRSDGSIVEDDLADTILWTGAEPSFKAFRAAKRKLSDLRDAYEALERYRYDVLGRYRDWMTDEDAPPSLDDLDEILHGIQTEMPAAMRQAVTEAEFDAPEVASTSSIATPTLPAKP